MRLLESAYRHGVSASDIRHAAANAIRHHDLDDGLVMLVGPDTTGALLEVGIIASDEAEPRIVHAMPARRSSSKEVSTMPRSAQDIIDHADDLADRFEAAEPNPLSDDGQDAVLELRDAVVDRGRAEARILAAVTRARAEGVSWSVLAATLGTTRQAAQQRYGKP